MIASIATAGASVALAVAAGTSNAQGAATTSADQESGTVYTGETIQGKKVVSALDVSDLEPGRKHLLYFQGVQMPTGQHWYVSVTVAKGAKPGKRVVLVFDSLALAMLESTPGHANLSVRPRHHTLRCLQWASEANSRLAAERRWSRTSCRQPAPRRRRRVCVRIPCRRAIVANLRHREMGMLATMEAGRWRSIAPASARRGDRMP
jgi:hypothetical protein